MAEYDDREHFIPFRKAEVVDLMCNEKKLDEKQEAQFRDFCKILASLYHFEFHDKVEHLKENYYPFNPDKDTKTQRQYSEKELNVCEKELVEKFKEVLKGANYQGITEDDLKLAMEEESLFNISLFVDFNDFDSYLLFWRGDQTHKATIKKFPFKKVEIDVPTFERVAMLVKFKDTEYFKRKKRKDIMFEPNSMVIKLFKNIPKADLEMLFPNTQVRMKTKDKLMMGIPAIAGGIPVLLKASAGILAIFWIIWLMTKGLISGEGLPNFDKDLIGKMVLGLTGLGLIGGYLWKQWTAYKNRKIQFMKTLADSLYFKNLDNNAGVFHHIIDAAEEEECKEAMLGYFFLLQNPEGMTEKALDDMIEEWFDKKHNTQIDFEVDDALRKLKKLELCTAEKNEQGEEIFKALPLEKGCARLDYIWDNYFSYNE